ncbi:MAG: hypothetical protein GY774_39500 [Planctomycetes bacterium]|nr:hypothetical protein [Planctomycetota bacterium]
MIRIEKFQRWFVAVFSWVIVFSLPDSRVTAEIDPMSPSQVKVMFMIKEIGGEGVQVVENAIIHVFRNYGYTVLDRDIVAQTLHREAGLLKLYEAEGAKRLGSLLDADIVVKGESNVYTEEDTLFNTEVHVVVAEVSVRAVLVSTGTVIAAENAQASETFGVGRQIALQKAAKALSEKLLKRIHEYLGRDTVDYRVVVLNVNDTHLLSLEEALRKRVRGVQEITERGFSENILKLDLRVRKEKDLSIKRNILTEFSGLGYGEFVMVVHEGKTLYLRRTDRAIEPPSPLAEIKTYNRGYRKSWALVIGINNYRNPKWKKLQYGVNDAQAVSNLLKRKGFDEVILLLDDQATKRNIERVLNDELPKKVQEEDRLLIYFAGHGQTRDLPDGVKKGYIIPVDSDWTNYYEKAISMDSLQNFSKGISAKHILYIMDSCFSGLLLYRGSTPYLTTEQFRHLTHAPPDPTTARSVKAITAGSQGERVIEVEGNGLFTKYFLSGLDKGEADLNGDGYITGSELFEFVDSRVGKESQDMQNPQIGLLGYGGGELVFKSK